MSTRAYSEAVEDYLIAIYKLQSVFETAKTSQIARELKLKDGTVSKVLNYLERKGLVERVKYRGVRLSSRGVKLAREALRRHRIIETFLNRLGFDAFRAHELAHKLEHLPREVVEAIKETLLPDVDTCPHGNPLLPELDFKSPQEITLEEAEEGKLYRLVKVLSDLRYTIEFLRKHDCKLGCVLQVVRKSRDLLEIYLPLKDRKVILDLDIAKTLAVKELKKVTLPLSELPTGARAKVVKVSGGRYLTMRLFQMGLMPGSEVEVVSNTFGPILVRVKGTVMAIGRGMASKILVEYLSKGQGEIEGSG